MAPQGGVQYFVDVFGRSAAVLLNVNPPYPIETSNDLEADVVNFFTVLREQEVELTRALYLAVCA